MANLRVCLALLLFPPAVLLGTHLPVKTYTTADGLPRDHVLCAVQDSHGFLWFCTAEGLSRFDGYQFTNYQVEQGLPSNTVTSFLEARDGNYWVATAAGLCRFDPAASGRSKFRCTSQRPTSALYQDAAGGVWCGAVASQGGLLRLNVRGSSFEPVPTALNASVTAILQDRGGNLWAGTQNGLFRRAADGSTRRFTTSDGLPADSIAALLEDREGSLWIGTSYGLARMDASRERVQRYGLSDGLPGARIQSLLETSDGAVWVGTTEGPAERTGGRPEFRGYTMADGLSGKFAEALSEDRDGNLWIASDGGAVKVARSGFTRYTASDGLSEPAWLLESRSGQLCVLTQGLHVAPEIGVFENGRFAPVKPRWPAGTSASWGKGPAVIQDHNGEWWFATGQGVMRFPRADRLQQLSGVPPKAVYAERDGLPTRHIFRLFEDSRGDVWIGTIGPGTDDALSVWHRDSGRVQAFSESDGLPHKPAPTAFAEDHAGDIWITLYHNAVARYRGGRFTSYAAPEGLTGFFDRVFVDTAGRLWVAGSRGLIRCDDPTAERPKFEIYTTRQGLSSSDIGAITEDRWGRIYAATGRGVDRFEPAPGTLRRLKHYTGADGIVPGDLELAIRTSTGALWFASRLGISLLNPVAERPRTPPPVLITALNHAGVAQPVSDLGAARIAGLRWARGPLRIDFVGLGFSPGEALRYQYRLDGADADWSAPADQRTVVYANLTPGSYRFAVRALTSDSDASPTPATVDFRILPPVWRTWWFLGSCTTLAALLLYGVYRYRVAQLLAVAHVRTRIATDLHDDIGASLSQIAILSEIAQSSGNGTGQKSLREIAGIARELVDSIGDIVWAINPDHDHLSNLLFRMRRFATDLLGGQQVRLQFRSSLAERDLKVGADVRRQVYLIFKEGIHNVARHAGATSVEIEVERGPGGLSLLVRDNGRGFDASHLNGGHGLPSMRRRAASLGGRVEVRSEPGQGSTLHVTVPLDAPRTLAMLRGK